MFERWQCQYCTTPARSEELVAGFAAGLAELVVADVAVDGVVGVDVVVEQLGSRYYPWPLRIGDVTAFE